METKDISNDLKGRTIYIPRMSYSGAESVAAAMRSVGLTATVSPASDEVTLELGAKYTSGDECYPEQITLGNFMKVLDIEKVDPKAVAFFMPTSDGPCRFGQYSPYLKKVLQDRNCHDAMIFSTSCETDYDVIGEQRTELTRTFWRGIVCTDILRKLLLKTRPYEINKGDSDHAYKESLDKICKVLEIKGLSYKEKLRRLTKVMVDIRNRFRAIPASPTKDRPLIGVVGEIFCRLNTFSNEEVIRKIEDLGGEAWLMGIAEWLYYVNVDYCFRLGMCGKKFSKDMFQTKIKNWVQTRDEHKLYEPFKKDFIGYEEAPDVKMILDYAQPYLPQEGALGEMVLSVGGAIYLYNKGVDGIVDIGPFTCMNGIICEAIFPSVSRDHDHIPIRNFFFDGTGQDLDRDIGIFLELARTYKHHKQKPRIYPEIFFKL